MKRPQYALETQKILFPYTTLGNQVAKIIAIVGISVAFHADVAIDKETMRQRSNNTWHFLLENSVEIDGEWRFNQPGYEQCLLTRDASGRVITLLDPFGKVIAEGRLQLYKLSRLCSKIS